MTFLYPLMLLTLLLIPVLIIIYLLLNRYKKEVISSTYIFEISNRFLKNKKRLNRFNNLWNLILQIIVVIILSFSLAHPIFYTKDKTENICFILDASGSMNIVSENKTRFERAKDEIKKVVNKSTNGSTYTLIYASNTSRVLLKNEKEKDNLLYTLKDLNPSYAYATLDSSLELALDYYQNGDISKVYVISDKSFETIEGVEFIAIEDNSVNYAAYDMSKIESTNSINVSSKVISYNDEAKLTVKLFIDEEVIEEQEIDVLENNETEVYFSIDKREYNSIKVLIDNEDSFIKDNEEILYAKNNKDFSILLVSQTPLFIKAMLEALSYKVDVIAPSSYRNQEGYGLYVFDYFVPETLPVNSPSWFMNPSSSVDNANFIVQEERTANAENAVTYSNINTALYEELIDGIKYNQIMLYKYTKCSLFGEYTPILNYGSDPLLFVNESALGQKQVVFSFDLHDSDLAFVHDYAVLMRNLLNYSLPTLVKNNHFMANDEMEINVLPTYDRVFVVTPSGETKYLNIGNNVILYTFEEIGSYKFVIETQDAQKEYFVYVSFDQKENLNMSEKQLVFDTSVDVDTNNAIFDKLGIIVFVLGIFMMLDWVVYTREQY